MPGDRGAARTGQRPGQSRAWAIVLTSVLVQMAALGVPLNCFTFFAVAWSQEFKTPISTLAAAFSALSVVIILIVPFVGRLCDQMSVRLILLTGVVLSIGVHVALSFVTAAWQIFALYVLIVPVAVTLSGLIPAQTLVNRWFTERRGMAQGVAAFGIQLSGVVFPLIVVLIMGQYGWRRTWWVFAAAITVIVIPLCLLVFKDRPATNPATGPTPGLADPAAGKLPAWSILGRRNVIAIMASFVLVQIACQGVAINLAPLLASKGIPRNQAAEILMIGAVAAIFSKMASGVASDRFGNRLPMMLGAILPAAGVFLVGASDNFAGAAAGYVLISFAGAQHTMMAAVCASEFPRSHFGRAFGLMTMFAPVGMLGPFILARWQEAAGSYDPAVMGLGAMAVIGGLVTFIYRRPQSSAGELA